VRRFIDRQIDELTEIDRHLLTAASVIRRDPAAPRWFRRGVTSSIYTCFPLFKSS
jgi:hypothetical protein